MNIDDLNECGLKSLMQSDITLYGSIKHMVIWECTPHYTMPVPMSDCCMTAPDNNTATCNHSWLLTWWGIWTISDQLRFSSDNICCMVKCLLLSVHDVSTSTKTFIPHSCCHIHSPYEPCVKKMRMRSGTAATGGVWWPMIKYADIKHFPTSKQSLVFRLQECLCEWGVRISTTANMKHDDMILIPHTTLTLPLSAVFFIVIIIITIAQIMPYNTKH